MSIEGLTCKDRYGDGAFIKNGAEYERMISVGRGALLPLPYSQGRLACSSSNGQTFSSSPKTKLSYTEHKKHMVLGSFKLTDIF